MITSVAQVELADGALTSDPVSPSRMSPAGESIAGPPADLLKNLPPSGRDFEVFHDVVVQGSSTRSAAREFKISQTRVCQVVERVRTWLEAACPAAAGEAVTERQLSLAMALAADRLDHLYSQALIGWNSSEGDIEKTRITGSGDTVTTKTISYGDPRYLLAAGKLTLLRAKLPAAGTYHRGLAAAADELEGPAPADAVPTDDHSVGDCSELELFKTPEGRREFLRRYENDDVASSSEELTHEQAAARRAFFGPVQERPPSDLAATLFRERNIDSKANAEASPAAFPEPRSGGRS
jgi:hypothetical protein